MLEADLARLKGDEAALRRELEVAVTNAYPGRGAAFRGRACRCPFHDDQTPSAGIFIKDGVWFFKCIPCGVGGTILDVRAKLNKRSVADELRAMNETTGRPYHPAPIEPSRTVSQQKSPRVFHTIDAMRASFSNVEGLYRYTNPKNDVPELIVLRYRDGDGKKRFIQAHPAGGLIVMSAPEGKLPIYNRTRIVAADYVVVVEGEKCVHALQEVGIVATTSPGGALKGCNADWAPLAGKRVYLWPDFDPINPDNHAQFPSERTGFVHMEQVGKILAQLRPACEIATIDPETLELKEKGDAADFVERYEGWTPEDVKAAIEAEVLADAKPIGPAGDYLQYLKDGIAGKRNAVPFPWEWMTYLSNALLPGTVTCIAGDPCCGKSLLVMQSLAYWNWCNIKACAYMLEDSKEFHMSRAHAQMERDSRIMETKWLEKNGELALQMYARCRQQLDEVGRSIWASPDEQVSLEMLSVWVEERAKTGNRVIVVDPVTAAASEMKPWVADCAFLFRVKTIARRFDCSVVLVVHPQKGHKGGGDKVDGMAGGAAYGRFSHTVIWLEVHDAAEELMVRFNHRHPPEGAHPNRVARIPKARNGPGHGKRIAFEFEGRYLTFRELGLVDKG